MGGSTTVSDILDTVAIGLDAADAAITDPKASAVTKGAAVLVRLLAGISKDRTPEEAIAILERIRDHGTTGITKAELDAQVAEALDKAAQGG